VGDNYSGMITNCYSAGSISGNNYVGGLVGYHYYFGMITNCYSAGSVSGNNYVGGLVGYNSYCVAITNCYSAGSVSGNNYVGGLVGYNGSNNCKSNIRNCYSTGSVTGSSFVGGLVGYNYGNISSSFWDVNTSGWPTSAGGTGKTTAEMKTKSTFTSALWDFVNLWDICEGTNYPRLQWQIPSGDFLCPYGVDFTDFAILASAWQSEPNEPTWRPACDISEPKDNFIDEFDLAVFCENWLEGQ
jgi:hypothetical protein